MNRQLVIFISITFLLSSRAVQAQMQGDEAHYLEKAEMSYVNEQYSEAMKFYRKTLVIDPSNHIAMYRLEVCKVQSGNRANCKKMKKAVALGYDANESELFFYGCK